MTDLGVRTRRIGTFAINRENIRVFAGGLGPTGRGANMRSEAESHRYNSMWRYACSPCAEHLFTQKAGSRDFPSSIEPRTHCGVKE